MLLVEDDMILKYDHKDSAASECPEEDFKCLDKPWTAGRNTVLSNAIYDEVQADPEGTEVKALMRVM